MTENTHPAVQQEVDIPETTESPDLVLPTDAVQEPEAKKDPLPKSIYKGVSFSRASKKWVAKALSNPDENGKRKVKHVGTFTDDREAALARNKYIEENGLTCRRSNLEVKDEG